MVETMSLSDGWHSERRGPVPVLCWLVLAAVTLWPWNRSALAGQADGADAGRASVHTRIVLVAGGDVMFGRFVRGRLRPMGYGRPFEVVEPVLQAADLALANLETPITARTYHVRKNTVFIFRALPEATSVLKNAGFDVLFTANNHAMDQYGPGILDTLRQLRRAGLVAVGTATEHQAACSGRVVEVKGVRVGFVAATLLLNTRRRPRQGGVCHVAPKRARRRLVRAVRDIAERSDVVVASLHWGYEYVHRPTWSQRRLARALVAAGAQVVLGHHPHVLQGIEHLGKGVVYYSLGNLVFDSLIRDTAESGLARVVLEVRPGGGRVVRAEFLPLYRGGKGWPVRVSPRRLASVLRHVRSYSRFFRSSTHYRVVGKRLIIERRVGGTDRRSRPRGE